MTGAALIPWVGATGLAGSLLFSTLSYAVRMMSRAKLEERFARKNRLKVVERIMDLRYEVALSSSTLRLVFNVLFIISIAYYFHDDYPNHPFITYALTLAISVPVLLIFSVAIPQAWAKYGGEATIAGTWRLLLVVNRLLYPVVAVMGVFDEIIRRLAGVTLSEDGDTDAEQVQEVMAAVNEGEAEGAFDEEQKKMIEGVISFRDLQVGQIMTPRTDIVALDVAAAITDVRDKIIKEGLSRLPVYEGSLDNIVGILYAKDLLKFLETPPNQIQLRQLMRPPLFVPMTKPLRDLLREMKLQQVHLAIVLDEYGGTAGLVTTEDIIEEIVGEIADEYERPQPADVKRTGERTAEVDARISIAELNRQLGLELPTDQEFNTLGGYVIATLGSIPVKGETLTRDGVTFTVLESEPRRVKRLRVELPEPQRPAEEEAAGRAETSAN